MSRQSFNSPSNTGYLPNTRLTLPANTKVKVVVKNVDAIPAEFESTDLSREVVIPGHTSVMIYFGPLPPG
ncbi:MAG: cupredoxin domain-containing protein, partial [Stellaceae bacterium]